MKITPRRNPFGPALSLPLNLLGPQTKNSPTKSVSTPSPDNDFKRCVEDFNRCHVTSESPPQENVFNPPSTASNVENVAPQQIRHRDVSGLWTPFASMENCSPQMSYVRTPEIRFFAGGQQTTTQTGITAIKQTTTPTGTITVKQTTTRTFGNGNEPGSSFFRGAIFKTGHHELKSTENERVKAVTTKPIVVKVPVDEPYIIHRVKRYPHSHPPVDYEPDTSLRREKTDGRLVTYSRQPRPVPKEVTQPQRQQQEPVQLNRIVTYYPALVTGADLVSNQSILQDQGSPIAESTIPVQSPPPGPGPAFTKFRDFQQSPPTAQAFREFEGFRASSPPAAEQRISGNPVVGGESTAKSTSAISLVPIAITTTSVIHYGTRPTTRGATTSDVGKPSV